MIIDQVFVTSINKAINRARVTGTFNLLILSILELYIYYIDYTEYLISLGLDYKAKNRQLKEAYLALKYKFPSVICNYRSITPIIGNPPVDPANTPPTVDDNSVNLEANSFYRFTVGDFLINFADAQSHNYKYLLVYPMASTANGNLRTNLRRLGTTSQTIGGITVPVFQISNELVSPIIFNIEGFSYETLLPLRYLRTNEGAFGPDTFTFRVSDNPVNYLYSLVHTMSIFADATALSNLPPADVGDRTIYVGNRAVTVFTLFDFTGGLAPPYNDPEGDLIDAIRIIDISNANQGKFYLNSVEVVEGQIITREDINSGLFTHEAEDTNSITSDVFEFEARDEGSGIWVQ